MSSGSDPIKRLGGDPPSPWEDVFGYCRVVDTGDTVFLGGTTSVDPSGYVVGEIPYEQAVEIFGKLVHELSRVGLGVESTVLTRMYVTDISRGDDVGRAHGEVFGAAPPVATMVEVPALIDPRMMVEVELVAVRRA
jgi:enamine deaminase RidA (YjgF/YER057c/UK114 family)